MADDDKALLCAYLKFYRTVYRWEGSAIFIVGMILLPFVRNLVHGNLQPDVDLYICILHLIHLIIPCQAIFCLHAGEVQSAFQRHDVLTNIRTAVTVVQYFYVRDLK